jgi:hypothetical protein
MYFGVVPWEGVANPLLGPLEGIEFRTSFPSSQDSASVGTTNLRDLFHQFDTNRAFAGISMDGRDVRVTVDSILQPTGDLYETLFQVTVDPPADPPVLFWTGFRSIIEPLVPKRTTVAPALWEHLKQNADSMFRAALPHYMNEGAHGQLRLGEPEAAVAGNPANRITVFAPATIEWDDGRTDDRASAFFIVAFPSDSIVFQRFGHPEWAPVSDEIVMRARPYLFFRVRRSPTVYFFGEWQLAWEHFGFGIYELATGRLVARSY